MPTPEVARVRRIVMFLAILNVLCCLAVMVMYRQQRISHHNLVTVIQQDVENQRRALEYARRSELMHQSLCRRQDQLAQEIHNRLLEGCPAMDHFE